MLSGVLLLMVFGCCRSFAGLRLNCKKILKSQFARTVICEVIRQRAPGIKSPKQYGTSLVSQLYLIESSEMFLVYSSSRKYPTTLFQIPRSVY